jgi:hypothetical protein
MPGGIDGKIRGTDAMLGGIDGKIRGIVAMLGGIDGKIRGTRGKIGGSNSFFMREITGRGVGDGHQCPVFGRQRTIRSVSRA